MYIPILRNGLGALGLSVLLLTGCAESARTKISHPPLAISPAPQTIFGEATLTADADPKAPLNIPAVPNRALTLEECISMAKRVSPTMDMADQNRIGAMWSRWEAVTAFLPTASATYSATTYDDMASTGRDIGMGASGRTRYAFQTQLTQPLFTGGRNSANYLLSQLGVDAADIQKTQSREDLLLRVKQTYYSILATEKALEVAKTTVVNLKSHLNVAKNFYEVGIVPKNQVLQAEVELAQAVQGETDLNRDLMVVRAQLNILLRQPVSNPIQIVDTLRYRPFPLTMEEAMNSSLDTNPELRLARNQVDSAAKTVDATRSEFYPQLGLTYTNTSTGNTAKAHGGWSNNDSNWNIAAVASFNFWEWGRTKAKVERSKVNLNRSVSSLVNLEDNTKLEVTTNYQNLISAAKNIEVSAKAVVSAAEDLRTVTERYMEQVATITEVLDAQTRYSEEQFAHYQSLFDYNLAWATLERSLGRPVLPNSGPRYAALTK